MVEREVALMMRIFLMHEFPSMVILVCCITLDDADVKP
jgi:hypothetical protein